MCCLDPVRATRSLRSFDQTCCGPQIRSQQGSNNPPSCRPGANPSPSTCQKTGFASRILILLLHYDVKLWTCGFQVLVNRWHGTMAT